MMRSAVVAILVIALGLIFFNPVSKTAHAAKDNSSERLEIPDWVFERCNRYPALAVLSGGTIILFYTKDETGICFAATRLRNIGRDKTEELRRQIENIKIVLARFGCWEILPGWESIVPGNAGPALIGRCEKDAQVRQFMLGYQNGIVFGFHIKW
jgi:hypothetical protein